MVTGPGAPESSGGFAPPLPAPGGPRRRRPGLLLAGLALGLAGIAVSTAGAARQILPRTFSPAQRQQIMAWEVAKRWRTWPAGQVFPAAVVYRVPGNAFGGGRGLTLTAHRVGIARQAGCDGGATDPATARALARHGCLAVLRATYTDQTQSLAVTVGVAVLRSAAAAHSSAQSAAGARGPLVRAVRFRRTPAAAFGSEAAQVPWEQAAGPYLVLSAAGFADGRPWQPAGNLYTRSELAALAGGVGRSVAAALGARPPVPHCPGSPGC